jgi:hypothetical protein
MLLDYLGGGMEAQSLINAGLAVGGFFAAWILNRIMQSLDRLDEDVRKLHEKYVAKEDYRRDISEIKEMLDKIFCKLDHKADK